MISRFVQPESVRLPLSGGDYIDIKRELNTGEQRRVFARMARDMTPGQLTKLDPAQVSHARVVEYLIGWSFVDAAGKPVPLSESAIDNLTPESYTEIREAIDQHEATLDAAREQAKNVLGTPSALTATSRSVA